MSTVYNKKDLHRHLRQILPAGYSMNSYGQFLLKEPENDRTIDITFGMREAFPHEVNFYSCSVSIIFHQVERIFHDVFENHSHLNIGFGHSLKSATFHKGISHELFGLPFILDNIAEVNVENDATFEQVRPYLEQMIDAALIFVNTHQTLQDFHALAEAMPIPQMAKFYGQPLTVRRIIVYKLMGLDYGTMATNVANNYNQDNKPSRAAFLLDLKNHLDNL